MKIDYLFVLIMKKLNKGLRASWNKIIQWPILSLKHYPSLASEVKGASLEILIAFVGKWCDIKRPSVTSIFSYTFGPRRLKLAGIILTVMNQNLATRFFKFCVDAELFKFKVML